MKRKGKIQSINFEDNIYKLLTEEVKKRSGSNYSSTLNSILGCILDIEDSVKEELAYFARDRFQNLTKKVASSDGFFKDDYLKQSKQYENLAMLFKPDIDLHENKKAFQELKMKDATLIVPNDWIRLGTVNDTLHTYAYVIEFKNGRNLPHFFFTLDKDRLSDGIRTQYLKYAAMNSESHGEVIKNCLDKPSIADISDKAIVPGFFQIPRYGTTDNYPFGAMIIDEKNTDKGGE